jgi:hypothetical protein
VDGRQVARTKAGGKVGYTVSDLRPGTYMLIVTAPGFRPEAVRVTVNGSGAVRNFVVAGDAQSAATLYGTVSGPGGQALPGATVTVNDGNGQLVEEAVSCTDGHY